MPDWNASVIAEFRANEGRVGAMFAGVPITLVHHVGRRSGTERVTPLVYLPAAADPDVIYVFATKGGAPTPPDWYHNLMAAGTATVEVGASTYAVKVSELAGSERDRIYAEQVARNPGFGDYEQKTAGVRTIPVLALRRV